MAGKLLRSRLERWRGPVSPPDPAAVAAFIEPALAQTGLLHVAIETKGEQTRSMTVVDRRRWRSGPISEILNVHVVSHLDTIRYQNLFLYTLLADEGADHEQ